MKFTVLGEKVICKITRQPRDIGLHESVTCRMNSVPFVAGHCLRPIGICIQIYHKGYVRITQVKRVKLDI